MPLSTCEGLIEGNEIPQSIDASIKRKQRTVITHISQTEQILDAIKPENVTEYCQQRQVLPMQMTPFLFNMKNEFR
ncbi:hypothetical protein SprV_0100174300 [Sparganum proliferum]